MPNHPLNRQPGPNTANDRPRPASLSPDSRNPDSFRADSPRLEPSRPDSPDALDQRLIRALEAAPSLNIPANFAERLASRLPARAPALDSITLPATRYGHNAILIGLAVLLAAMLVLAAHAANHATLEAILEWTLCAQFVALTIWFTTSRKDAS